jgi:hypothetical protein
MLQVLYDKKPRGPGKFSRFGFSQDEFFSNSIGGFNIFV